MSGLRHEAGPSDAPAAPTEQPQKASTARQARTDDGLEWEDLMPEINRASDPSNMIWKLIDRETGAENGAISWAFTVGDRVKIRLVNEMESDHPMHHPFHVHGAGRFLVLSRDGEPESNLVWKDTVLVRAGQTVDILLDVSNPGLWMAHCHIAEHAESGMMFSFDVARAKELTEAEFGFRVRNQPDRQTLSVCLDLRGLVDRDRARDSLQLEVADELEVPSRSVRRSARGPHPRRPDPPELERRSWPPHRPPGRSSPLRRRSSARH